VNMLLDPVLALKTLTVTRAVLASNATLPGPIAIGVPVAAIAALIIGTLSRCASPKKSSSTNSAIISPTTKHGGY